VARNDRVVTVDQHRIRESERIDAVRDLTHLPFGVRS
jgi:hypothetical protein